jgi:hypothetical protein
LPQRTVNTFSVIGVLTIGRPSLLKLLFEESVAGLLLVLVLVLLLLLLVHAVRL